MTYSALQLFKSIFLTEGKNAPTTSDYAEHLNGNTPLVAKFEDSRFIMAKWLDGEIDGHTPLVKFVGNGEKWLGLFLKHKTENPKELFERISCYFPVELDFPEEVELPFFGASLERLSPLNDDGNNFRFLEEALEYLKDKAVNEADIGQWEDCLPFKDAPFCVQSYYLLSNELPRFAGPYLDAKDLPTKFADQAEWFAKNTAPMDCKNIKWICDKEKCKKRKYGFDSSEMAQLQLGKLTQYKDEPVFYVWEINGNEVRFENEIDLMRQDRFLPIVMRQLGTLPKRMSNERWLQVLNKALSNMERIGGTKTAEMTIDIVRDILVNDLRDRTLVATYYEHERLLQGWLYIDPSSSTMVCEPNSLCSYITGRYKELRVDGIRGFMAVLRHLGFKGKHRSIDGIDRTLWFVRVEFLFDDRESWKRYMLSVSEGTSWELNFKAFLEDGDSGIEPLSEELKDEIDKDAAIFLDTEKQDD